MAAPAFIGALLSFVKTPAGQKVAGKAVEKVAGDKSGEEKEGAVPDQTLTKQVASITPDPTIKFPGLDLINQVIKDQQRIF